MTKEIGFIGIGKMGGPMVGRLVDAGYRTHVFDLRKEAIATMVSRGCVAARSPADLASKVETVLVSLPMPDVVKEVVLGADGVVDGSTVKTCVDFSTTGPQVAVEVAAALAKKGITALDAPVSGGVGGAQKGTLAIMVSSPSNLCDELRPLFEVTGRHFYIGDKPGMGQTMKLANNMSVPQPWRLPPRSW